MTLVTPCIRGKMGNTEFFEAVMSARDVVMGARPASELDEWTTMSIEERMQRDPNLGRILKDIAPYIADSPDRFFGSIIVLVYRGEVHFESIKELGGKLPGAYRASADNIGFITIDGGQLIILDGQHRVLALEKVMKGEIVGKYSSDVPSDDVNVLFIQHESNEKTRRIFNKVNRYAKTTSRGDNIITSEDDGWAIITRWLLRDGAPFGIKDSTGKDVIINWRTNTLAARSVKFTTISAIYDSAKWILADHDVKLDEKVRPSEEHLTEYYEVIEWFWRALLTGLKPYKEAFDHPDRIPDMRDEKAKYSLLFKPAAQIALVKGLIYAKADDRLTLEEAVKRANSIDWNIQADHWKDVLIKGTGAIDAGPEARERAAQLIAYLIAADKMGDVEIAKIKQMYRTSRGDTAELPEPVVPLKSAGRRLAAV